MKDYLTSFQILSENEIEDFIKLCTKRELKKSEFFIKEAEVCKEVGFVVKGILRSFYVSEKGEETTYCMMFPNNLITAYSSFITSETTSENIQAITPVELFVISKYEVDKLVEASPNWVKFLKVMAEQQYIELEKRIFQLQKSNALQRYTDLITHQPHYIKRIPLQYLASYLGVTQRHLSRIRKEINL